MTNPKALRQHLLGFRRLSARATSAKDAPLVKFIKEQEAYALQGIVGLEHTGEYAFGEDFDAGCLADFLLKTNAVAYGLTHLLTQQLRHAGGDGLGSKASGFEHQYFLRAQPILLQ